MEEPGFWDNADKANNSMKELKNLKDTVEEYHRLETAWEDVETLLEMGYEENDASLIPEVQEAMADFEKRFEPVSYTHLVLGITTALVVSACTVPAMAAPITINTDQSISVVSTDSTYVGGLDLEARIITTVEQDQRSPYAKKGIAVADDYLKIHTEPNGDAEVVGKLYSGSGCEIEEVKDGWAHITSRCV